MAEAILSISNLNKTYDNKNQVLFDVEFDLNKGELVSIIGPSGAGKSTILRCINRLTEPDEGTIVLVQGGENIAEMTKSDLKETRKNIGMIFQHYNLVERLTALENVLHGRLGYYSALKGALGLYTMEDSQKAVDLLTKLGLGDHIYKKCSQLSGGQKQRVGIARALIQEPKSILCDEPIASLDPQSSMVIMEYLRDISKELEIPCLVNLHQVDVAKEYADRIIGVKSGRVVFLGRPDELTDGALENIYGAKIDEILA